MFSGGNIVYLDNSGFLWSASSGSVAPTASTSYSVSGTGTITVKNTGDTTITGPLYVFFTLPAGVTLPSLPTYGGLPYLRFDLQGGLAPGAMTGSAVLTFTDPTNARIAYTTTRSAINF